MNEALLPAEDGPRPSAIERQFARFIARLDGRGDPVLRAAARLVSRATGNGDVCLQLAEYAGRVVPDENFSLPPLEEWSARLRASSLVGGPGEFRPLVLDDAGRLYLYRYWQYEQALADQLLRRACDAPDVDIAALRDGLERLFPDPRDGEQKRAAAMAVLRRFCVISGGPGTGKTHTVVKILALLAAQARGGRLAVALAAPTGKAAARVQESVRQAVERFAADDPVRACIPAEAHTLHRLLGARPGSVRYRHDREHPLALDVLVVDEASMADLALMAKLLAALPAGARLILLGDKDQLASVEAGAVLGDICAESGFTRGFAARLAAAGAARPHGDEPEEGSPLADSIALLNRSYRFGSETGIGQLATAVNRGDGPVAMALLNAGNHSDIAWKSIAAPQLKTALAEHAFDRLSAYLEGARSGNAVVAFERFNAFRVLCAHRNGPAGAIAVNQILEAALDQHGLIDARRDWYAGRPVMVARNDYGVQLFNGDVGITLPDPDAGGALKVFFPDAGSAMRKIAPLRLPEHETAYAMTVHKAQGSEFAHVLLILPGEMSRVLSRELVYTGITRARQSVEIWSADAVLAAAIERRLARASALRDRLWLPRVQPLK
jgi:exodeoxyribonuclease V alpha subunit